MNELPPAAALAAALALGLTTLAPSTAAAPERDAAAVGVVAFPTSGAPAAQETFLRGVAALHSFWYDEAADLFQEAQEVDPGFALAYWGEAMTYNHPLWAEQDRDAARDALARLGPDPASRAARAPTEREREWLAAVETLYGDGDKPQRDEAYSAAMARLHERYPDDLEAAAFYALSLLGLQRPGAWDPRISMRAAAVAEEVFAANPRHPGAAHYLIHAYDDPVHAPLGLRAARVYAEIAPAAHHALHMPSHIFVQLGMWERAAASNEDAWAASVAWVEGRGHPDTKRDFHSLSWLQYAYLQLGRRADARETMERVRALIDAGNPSLADRLHLMQVRQAVETGRWEELPPREERPDGAFERFEGSELYGDGVGAARRGDLDRARRAAERLEELAREAAGGYRAGPLRIQQLQVTAETELASGNPGAALDRLAEAAALEAELDPPSGPPYPFQPAHERYGQVLLDQGRSAEAREAFAASLLRTPERAASLLGAARAARAAGDPGAAAELYGRLAAVWRAADRDWPALTEVGAGANPPEPAPEQ